MGIIYSFVGREIIVLHIYILGSFLSLVQLLVPLIARIQEDNITRLLAFQDPCTSWSSRSIVIFFQNENITSSSSERDIV